MFFSLCAHPTTTNPATAIRAISFFMHQHDGPLAQSQIGPFPHFRRYHPSRRMTLILEGREKKANRFKRRRGPGLPPRATTPIRFSVRATHPILVSLLLCVDNSDLASGFIGFHPWSKIPARWTRLSVKSKQPQSGFATPPGNRTETHGNLR